MQPGTGEEMNNWSTIALYESSTKILKDNGAQYGLSTDNLDMIVLYQGKKHRFASVEEFNGFCRALELLNTSRGE